MIYSLPRIDKEPVPLPHFPTRHQAFLFRAYEYVPVSKIAQILGTSEENVRRAAAEMGLSDDNPSDVWLTRGYITIIRRMWHILPYEQLLTLLDMDEETLARLLRDEDFLEIKLASKPRCECVVWRELSEEERQQTKAIKQIMSTLDISGKAPFAFDYRVPRLTFCGEERIATRMIYAFSGLYQHAFDIDNTQFLSDEQLAAYQALGINGIWTQGLLSQLAPFPFDPALSEGYEARLARMREMTERLAAYGIKLYLYLNEPRAMPLAFFEKRHDIQGHICGDEACLCTSTEAVQAYLTDAVESLCRAVPRLGGFFTITRSENLTNCYSYAGEPHRPCACPRCRDKSVGKVIAETIGCILNGTRRVSPDMKVFAWSWRWDAFSEQIIRALPEGVILLSQSELDMPFAFGGVRGNVLDYSMSITGPGALAKNEWRIARERGLEIGAKVQVNTTWEASTVPAIPVSPSIDAHMKRLSDEGVRHLLLSWTLGGYPCRNLATAAQYFYETCSTDAQDDTTAKAEQKFVEAFSEFPFHIRGLYRGPQNAGPSNLLFEKPTGYHATMTCFAYDDLDAWRSIYPLDVYESQYEKLCEKWECGLRLLSNDDKSETAIMARAAYCLFRSSLNQIRFIRARDEGRNADAVRAAQDELTVAEEMLSLMNQNAAIGYEAANHYYFSKGQLAEKILNCHHIIQRFQATQGEQS